MILHAPQIIYSILLLLGSGISIALYGKPRTDSYDIVDCLIGPAICFSLLYWGGFYG